MRMIFPCFSVSVGMNDPKLAGECRGLANQKMLADPVLIPTAAPRHCPECWQIRTGGAGWFADPVPRDFRNAVTCQRWRSKPARWKFTVHSTGSSGSSTLSFKPTFWNSELYHQDRTPGWFDHVNRRK